MPSVLIDGIEYVPRAQVPPPSAAQLKAAPFAARLKVWHRHWKLIDGGTMLHCSYCASAQRAKDAGRVFVHDPCCKRPEGYAASPWHALAELLSNLPAEPQQ